MAGPSLADYYKAWPNGLDPTGDPSYFPIGVWLAGVYNQGDIDGDKAVGLNTYVGLTTVSDIGLVRANGMRVILQLRDSPAWEANPAAAGGANTSWLASDEIDMQQGPGWGSGQGFSMLQSLLDSLPKDGRMRYNNFGKGVLFWESNADAATFVGMPDVVSADSYWFSDPDLCQASQGGTLFNKGTAALTPAECQRPGNYGAVVDRLRNLEKPVDSKPVWAFIELGHPGTGNGPNVTPAQVTAAVWSSLVHGARGIQYFNHSFGGPEQTQNVLRDPYYANVRAAVAGIDQQITSLAPVLNAYSLPGVTVSTGTGAPVSTMLKQYQGHTYLFAMSDFNDPGTTTTQTITIPGAGTTTASVLNENRTVAVDHGHIVDGFPGWGLHIYQIG